MSVSSRRFAGMDLTYAEAHRRELPFLYRRIGHRLDTLDRDWTEFCHWCKEPLGLYEEFRDDGRNLNDKNTRLTRRVAERADLPAFLFAYRVDRPADVQREIDALNRRVFALQAQFPISGFRARQLRPQLGPVLTMTPGQWWELGVLVLHRAHHATCPRARAHEIPVDLARLEEARNATPLWTPDPQLKLERVA